MQHTQQGVSGLNRQISRVGVIAATHRPEALHWAVQYTRRLRELGVEVRVSEQLRGHCGEEFAYGDKQFLADTDLVIVLGGDGTLLSMARCAGPVGTPMLGLDVGSFGFLAADAPDVTIEQLERVLTGDYMTESRQMLALSLENAAGEVIVEDSALNDVVISSRDGERMVSLQTEIDGELLGTYRADGLIVATPTGSTGYNLSAGGPVVEPNVSAIIVTAICPHTVSSRPIVLPDTVEVKVTVPRDERHTGPIRATMDGQETHAVALEWSVVVKRAAHEAHLVRLRRDFYFANLVEKLMPGLGG